jgi:major membrane immunogen (membrane-anchored lipoprotein)
VTDDKGAIGKDTVQVTVISNTTLSQPVKQNIAPIANAGADQTIALPTSSVTLTGSGNDSDGTIAAYQWTEISGPSATITAASSATTTIKGLVQGTYQFELKVTDDKGAIGKDTVQITVNNSSSPVNIAPTANAGSDITTVSSVQSVTITGSGTDPDGKIKSYSWSEISGPSTATISGSNSATIKVRNLIEGTYQFELKVTDDKGATGRDTVNVTVALERTSSTSTSNVTVKTTSLKVYPNPVHDVATVEITAPSTNTNIMIVITDINGKTVYTDQFVSTSTYVQKQINMSSLIKGTYFISVYFDGMQQQTVKVMRL